VVRNPQKSGGRIIILVKWCYSAEKSVFGVAPATVQWTHYVASLTLNNNNNNQRYIDMLIKTGYFCFRNGRSYEKGGVP